MLAFPSLVLALAVAGRATQDPANAPAAAAPAVDLGSLVAELADRRRLCLAPRPAYASRFAGAGGDATGEVVEREGRRERVLFDVDGPGALVRLAAVAPDGVLRVYLDGADEPALEAPLPQLLSGAGCLPADLAVALPGGSIGVLPVPFARHCRMTCDADPTPAVEVQWRAYAPGTAVTTLQPGELARRREEMVDAVRALAVRDFPIGSESYRFGKPISSSGTGGTSRWNAMSLATGDAGPQMVTELSLGPLEAEDPEQLAQLLRRTVLFVTCDGVETVRVPLGDFFGSAPGIVPHAGPYLSVTPDGTFTCRLPMPYRRTCFLRVESQMDVPFTVPGLVTTEPIEWTDDTLYFHASWSYEPYLECPPRFSWPLVAAHGRGLLVGEWLGVGSRDGAWRAGRARLVADGAGHRSAGLLEGLRVPVDAARPWWSPLASVPRCTAPDGDGWTSVVRQRTLDVVPFEEELRYELGTRFPGGPPRSYAATTWYYGDLGLRAEASPVMDLAALGITPPQ